MQFNCALDCVNIYEAGKPIELVVREYGIAPNQIIKLASNENPFGAAPKVIQAIIDSASNAHLYPDDSMFALKESLAKRFNVEEHNIIIGSGSDQVIEMAVHAKCNANSKVLMAGVTFAMYEIYAKQVGAQVLRTKSAGHDLTEFLKIYERENPAIIFLCMPNNPLGECLDYAEIEEFLSHVSEETLVIVDGAYQEYARFKDSHKGIVPSALISRFPNAIYLGTFSKAYGLGGMRIGYGIAQEAIIKNLLKLRAPFNITTLSLASAVVALKEWGHVEMSLGENFSEMIRYEEFARENGLEFIPSFTNFITILLGNQATSSNLAQWLLERGLIIRNLRSYGMNAIRITIGTHAQNSRCLELMHEYLRLNS